MCLGMSPCRLSRREVLRGAAAAAATALLAACGSGAGAPTAPPTVATPTPALAIPSPTPAAVPASPLPPTVAVAPSVPPPTTTNAPAVAPSLPAAATPAATVPVSVAAAPTGTSGPALQRLLTIDGGPERLRTPGALALGPDGNLYIGEYVSGNSVKVFAPDGTFLRKWGKQGEGDGEFAGIQGIAVDTRGTVYVADFGNTRVQVFDNAGRFVRTIPTEPPIGPIGVALDAGGTLFVLNHRTHDHYVQQFSPDGSLLRAWGMTGTGPGEIGADRNSGPTGFALDAAGNVYVGDIDNSRLNQYAPDGTFLRSIGTVGAEDDQFRDGPYAVALDRAGNIYVTDRGDIVKFDSAGKFLVRWRGTNGAPWGPFRATSLLVVDAAGDIYIRYDGVATILKFHQG